MLLEFFLYSILVTGMCQYVVVGCELLHVYSWLRVVFWYLVRHCIFISLVRGCLMTNGETEQ